MTTPIRLYLPRIYLDTNVLISAILETDEQWKRTHNRDYQAKKIEIESSNEIFLRWEHRADQLKTSTFAIGEFIGAGNKQFGKSFKEMLDIVDSKILDRCKICRAENLQYDKELIPRKMQKEIRFAEIVGEAQVGTEFRYAILFDMAIATTLSGNDSELARVNHKDLVMQKIRSYSAPGFEIMLFQKVSELANKYGLGLADAFHVFYARGQAEYLITNDKGFLDRWEKDPKARSETRIEAMGSMRFLEFCKRYKLI